MADCWLSGLNRFFALLGCRLDRTLSLKGKFSSCSLQREVREGSSPLELADSLCLAQGLCSRHGGAWPLLLQLNCAPATSSLDSMCASFLHTNLLISVQRYELWAMSSLMSNVWVFQTHDRSPNTSLECLAHKSELWWHSLHLYYTLYYTSVSPVSLCFFSQLRHSFQHRFEPAIHSGCMSRGKTGWTDKQEQHTDIPIVLVYNEPQPPLRWHKVQNKTHKLGRNSRDVHFLQWLVWSQQCERNVNRPNDLWRSIFRLCLWKKTKQTSPTSNHNHRQILGSDADM